MNYIMNEDIMRHIYSFGYPEHRVYMKQLSKDIHINGNINPIGWPENRLKGEALCVFLRRKTYEELIDLYKTYKQCRCCTRHCYYKPNLVTMNENVKLEPNPYYSYENLNELCPCKCRHNLRLVYRALS
jgi:hypothetical protein